MVCTANYLSAWKDFPKGLSVLLLAEDSSSAAEMKSKLEAMDYIVSIFCNENEALSVISSKPESFHVAIVELGAVEFLWKPLSEDKLRNIWQHVVHKLQVETEEPKNETLERIENTSPAPENDYEYSSGSDRYPAPSTPQLKQGARLLDDGDYQDLTNCSTEKESEEHEGESKSVETTCAMTEETLQVGHPQSSIETLIKEKDDSADVLRKYRMHRRHILPKEDDRRWSQQRDPVQRSYSQHKPIMAYPLHPNHTFRLVLSIPSGEHLVVTQLVSKCGAHQAMPHGHQRKLALETLSRDAWGCPVMPPPHNPYSSSPQNVTGFHSTGMVDNGCNVPQNSFNLHPAEEVVDKVVKEAINKPWLPLPLGLKPPSTDTVLAELSRQGISRIPPHINDSNSM
ncbi:hypothetical protein GH714_041652 [Hevea brasiliensis]|uniref:Response regulatory domain-containing protein n=1 Tax=Hevea brasiliensis TaxID=3981 RepID=A0A6A6MR96_HEVBR|nr:hypothetical protein GH714_041652 [Hevea brasiliensis]